ncbi:MAG: S41 family peptidase, partial [Bacteroidota bacterium]
MKAFAILLPLALCQLLPAQDNLDICNKTSMLTTALEKYHYQPRDIDNELSSQVFNMFFDLIDPEKVYFTRHDMDSLSLFKELIDDEILNQECKFFYKACEMYKKRLMETDSINGDILGRPFDFMKDDKMYMGGSREGYDFAKGDTERTDRLRKRLKYHALMMMLASRDSTSIPDKEELENMLAKQNEIRELLAKKEKRHIQRILNHGTGFESLMVSLFMNSIAMCYDPHTMYFTFNDFTSFESELSSEALSFGLEIDEKDNGNLEITRLVPGGPAWKSNELNNGDELVKMKWEKGEEIDLAYADIYEVMSMLSSTNDQELELTVRKAGGQIKKVTLRKEVIQSEENVINSFILEGKYRIGYIALPGFYTEWENFSGLGCANDVAKEILKLQKEGIDGLIFDLRNNGGGAMKEAMDLAGIFIDGGPLTISKVKGENPVSLKDMNRGTIYDGPLIIMVNKYSASASEILAAALQDHNRALIVGSPTFGKSTGQMILPMDTAMNRTKATLSLLKKELDIIKVTDVKFYRITGKSHQATGVIPDILLPELETRYDESESDLPYYFANDSIQKKSYYTPMKDFPISLLGENSRERTARDPVFEKIVLFNDTIDKLYAEKSEISLIPETFV